MTMHADIIAIIRAASEMGANAALRRLEPATDRISQRQAVAEYGLAFLRDNADRLTVTRNGNRKEYSRAELEQVKAARNVATIAVRIEYNLINTNKKDNGK